MEIIESGQSAGLRKVRRALWALVALTLVIYIGLQFFAPSDGTVFQVNEVYGRAPAFTLVDQQGQSFSSDVLAGKVWLVNFIFTRCVDECPRLSGVLANVSDRLAQDGLLGERVRIVSITVDPDYDTPEVMGEYAGRFQADPKNWHFLTGERDYIQTLLTQGFYVTMINRSAFAPLQSGIAHAHGPPGTGIDIIHSERIILVDTEGNIIAYIEGLATPPDEIADQVKALL